MVMTRVEPSEMLPDVLVENQVDPMLLLDLQKLLALADGAEGLEISVTLLMRMSFDST